MGLQLNIVKNCVRQMEMDQMECARDYMFWIFDHFLTSPSIHTYIQYIVSWEFQGHIPALTPGWNLDI
jgi:hypothetical protein